MKQKDNCCDKYGACLRAMARFQDYIHEEKGCMVPVFFPHLPDPKDFEDEFFEHLVFLTEL